MCVALPLAGKKLRDATHDDGTAVGLPGEAADQLEFDIRAVAAHLEIDPATGSPDMGIAKPVAGGGMVALMRIVEPDARV